ncbi:DUF1800 family protein [Sphingomonas sp.]|uniref:DUF1800 domain-containing protein n=1 Tax=Sphingomonas sp. TaxID=28214 RepID=UPI001D727735|nr:DUF1800 family protein [Sphingomonas sp.]MBX9797562.1 DUF1800 domain-containing protein [Sphingomonas sp.]
MSDNVRDHDAELMAPAEADVLPKADAAPVLPRGVSVLPVAAAGALAACSGGGGGGAVAVAPTPTPAPTPAPPPPPTISAAQASRFLQQASFGATGADIDAVQSRGFSTWIDDQIALPRTAHWDWLVANNYTATTFQNNSQGFDNSVWRQMISEPGQLRQRVGMALSEIMVIGVDGLNLSWRQFAGAVWLDILLDNAFGNFRTLMERITFSAPMASYLTYLNNRRANPTTGSVPDENYARELMQLFTIGLNRLNMDGSLVLSGGQPVDTYSQTDVSQLARVFTGFALDGTDNSTPDRLRRPLVFNNANRETGTSSFLGATVPAGSDGATAVRIALDAIFAHPNVPPFISRQLIQRLVTSNPSPAYIQRVSQVFADNGSGTRGDLRAVVRAILLDTEARGDATLTQPTFGKLREPVIRLTNWARAFRATSAGGLWPIGDTSSANTRLAQSMGRSPSVFNFFRPGYSPPNTSFSANNLVAPEFQITNELSVIAYVNYMQAAIQNGIGNDVRADYAEVVALATDSTALVDRVNLLLAANQLSAATVGAIRAAVDSIATTATNAALNRVYTAILLTMASPEYITQR